MQSENTYSCFLKVAGQIWENQKRINININHIYHQHSSLYVTFNWSNTLLPIGKDGVQYWLMKQNI